ncbi:hypothetical protein DIPPA_17021 [Diplonema papillatum]|nr:hypothetical protein DIPPA_17021 [Diplonema papillatum]
MNGAGETLLWKHVSRRDAEWICRLSEEEVRSLRHRNRLDGCVQKAASGRRHPFSGVERERAADLLAAAVAAGRDGGGSAGEEEAAAVAAAAKEASLAKGVDGDAVAGATDAELEALRCMLGIPERYGAVLTRLRHDFGFAEWVVRSGDDGRECRDEGAGGAGDRGLADVLLDLFVEVSSFAVARRFSAGVLSCLWGVVIEVHRQAVTERCSRAESVGRLLQLLLNHSVNAPPFGTSIMTPEQVEACRDFVTHAYHDRYNMYQHCFAAEPLLDFAASGRRVTANVKAPLNPRPLAAAVPHAAYQAAVEARGEKEAAKAKAAAAEERVRLAEHRREQLEELKEAAVRAVTESDLAELEARITSLETADA